MFRRLQSAHFIRSRRNWLMGFVALGAVSGLMTLAEAKREETIDAERLAAGKATFRFDTFGDEQRWTDVLRLHEVIESAIDPLTALSLGLKVDLDALPEELLAAIAAGDVNLAS